MTKRRLPGTSAKSDQEVVSQTFTSWNHITFWLRKLDNLRAAAARRTFLRTAPAKAGPCHEAAWVDAAGAKA